MIRASIETLVMGSVPGASVVVLRPLPSEDEHDRILPICIGSVEAAAIGKALSEEPSSRPMTHALIGTIVAQLGGKVEKVVIDKVRGTIFYATLCIKRGSETVKIDARPSDAIAIAVRLKVPIYINESVLASASFPTWVNIAQEQQKAEMEEFHSFVEGLSPEDFVVVDREAGEDGRGL